MGLVLVSSLTALYIQRHSFQHVHSVDLSKSIISKEAVSSSVTAPATSIKHDIVRSFNLHGVAAAGKSATRTTTVSTPSLDLETAYLLPSSVSKSVDGVELLTTSSRQQAVPVEKEVARVMVNLDKCLSAANLTDYFVEKGLLPKARRNAEHFLTTLRQSIPTVFNSSYSSPCWEINLEMKHCINSVLPTCQSDVITGSLGSLRYRKFKSNVDPALYAALTSTYPNGLSSSVVCLPKLFLAGFPKCGSSYLYCLLEQLYSTHQMHSLVKEPHFWVPRGPFGSEKFHQIPHDGTDLGLYLLNFQPAVQSELDSRFSFPIDGSPNLLFQWRLYGWSEGMENYCLAPAVLPQVLPDSKFIIIMRNPVDMLHSSFWYSCSDLNIELTQERQKKMPDEFHMKVLKKIHVFQDCLHSAPIDKCMMDVFKKLGNSYRYCGRIRLEIGFYYLYIRKWLAIIPREQFLFLATEDLTTGQEAVEKKIMDFLGSSRVGVPHHEPRDGVKSTRGSTFCNNIQTRYDYHHNPQLQMRDDTRQLLTAFYQSYNRELATLLHDDKYVYLWAR